MNTAIKGRKYEWKIRDKYKSLGFHVTRSAGSKGLFDLIAISVEDKVIRLIQCKHPSTKLSKQAKQTILDDLKTFEGQYTVIGELV